MGEPQRQDAFLVGMTGTLVVNVDSPEPISLSYEGVRDWSWPEALTLEVCISNTPDTADFRPSAGVLRQLGLRYFVELHQAQMDSLWRTQGVQDTNKSDILPRFWFNLDLSPGWAGKYLCVRARYDNPRYGNLSTEIRCFPISAPCSKRDSALVNLGNIVASGYSRDYARTIAITDSLLKTGWSDRVALRFAIEFASRLHRHDDVLRYIDIQFERYGNIGFWGGEEVVPVTTESRAHYDSVRHNILRLKAEYEQQQH
jgi:hypothetical protein